MALYYYLNDMFAELFTVYCTCPFPVTRGHDPTHAQDQLSLLLLITKTSPYIGGSFR